MSLVTLALAVPLVASAADSTVDLDRFQPALDAPGFVTTRSSVVGAPWTAGGALLGQVEDDPLVVRDADSGEEQGEVVGTLASLEAAAWLNLPRVRVGITAPFPLVSSGPSAQRVVGDLSLEGAGEVVRRRGDGAGLGVYTSLKLPTGDDEAWLGDAKPNVALGLTPSVGMGRATVAAHAGLRTGTGVELNGWTWGPSLEAGIGTSVAVIEDLAASLEFDVAHVLGLSEPQATPLQGHAALHWSPVGALQVLAGAGAGLSQGIGAPDWRLFAGVGWQPGPTDIVQEELQPVVQAPAPTSSLGEIAVRVTDPDGQPVAARVVLQGDGEHHQLEGEGRLARAVEPGAWTVAAEAEGFRRGSVQLQVGPGEVGAATLVLAPWTVGVELDRLVLPDRIHFPFDSAVIQDTSYALMAEVAELLQQRDEIARVMVMGHADERGSRAYNLDLSRRRAQAVVDWLVAAGVDADRLEAHAFGEEVPAEAGASEQALARNRRVELLIVQRTARR